MPVTQLDELFPWPRTSLSQRDLPGHQRRPDAGVCRSIRYIQGTVIRSPIWLSAGPMPGANLPALIKRARLWGVNGKLGHEARMSG
jgi:hypothetical protein